MSSLPTALGRITPATRMVRSGGALADQMDDDMGGMPAASGPRVLSPREKAAIIVRLTLAEGQNLPITSMPEHLQAALAEQMGQMRLVDRGTLSAVVEEFLDQLEDVGLSFPDGIDGALAIMDGHITTTAASRLRRLASASAKADPWDQLNALANDRLLPFLEDESIEVAAVMLSKLPVPKAAELLAKLPGERARRVAYAVSQTSDVDPETVRRIGLALTSQLNSIPPKAFEAGPVERMGAILNLSAQATRDDVLTGLDEADSDFASRVRRAIFTFEHIPRRLGPRDVPKVVRAVGQEALVTALAAAAVQEATGAAVEHFLSNISQRLANVMREEMVALGEIPKKDGEMAMGSVIDKIRQLERAGELVLKTGEEA